MFRKKIRILNKISLFIFTILLSGCNDMVLMHPKGGIGLMQRSLILTTLSVMLIVVLPAILMTIIFVFKYRTSKRSEYEPNWSQSKFIESIIWIVPVLIITFLSILTWKSTHILDPKKSINSCVKPIQIEVIALDWKWLFIYPNENIATINEISFPVNVPVKFRITSNSVMNSFFIPQLGSQIYAMAGMETNLNLISDKSGLYKGISSNFSGYGFSGMKFNVIVNSNQNDFYLWIKKIKKSKKIINNMVDYEKLATPSSFNKVEYFSQVQPKIFDKVIDKFMEDNCKKSLLPV